MEDPARVVHLAAYGGPYAGSFIPMLLAAQVAAAQAGAEFSVVFGDGVQDRPWMDELRGQAIDVHVAPPLPVHRRPAWLGSFLPADAGRTLLHTHFSEWDVAATIVARRRRAAGAIWHLHSAMSDTAAARARNLVRFAVLGRLTERILCVGPGIHAQALARLAPRDRTRLFINGIDTGHFRPRSGGPRTEARRQLGLPIEGACLLIYAWDWERKGGTLLLEAVRLLRERERPVFAAVVGDAHTIGREAERFGVEAVTHVLAPAQDTRVLYAAADLFVSASSAEGMPFALMEAVACGVPAVASDIPSHRFTVQDLPACRIFARTPEALGAAIAAQLDADPDQRTAELARSRATLEGALSLETWSRRLGEIYTALLQPAR